ncbi:sulfite exporter TauE/SafE family protein [Metabacillus sp. GX 13764]|uniref:sulfite exporter TauE/SafE family protein n=1 Tax=Metabacillus kandeliae TaxID=2900151 RepID=UPI001E44EF63|nr:sulfite exporter TauE/SafE family protein [Metabacillus kandeliae]MCD7035674.1 sulfite exporter TauE/SafE family protein [Metabacillus kandeliae]
MSMALMITLFLIGLAGSFISGMLGIGGAIINYPMLLYIPALLGLASFTPHDVSGISTVQALFASISGVLIYRKGGYLNKRLILYMGVSVLAGSFLGGFGSRLMSEAGVNIVYGILALLAVVMMLIPKKGLDEQDLTAVVFNKWLASALAFAVGIAAGIVGAGGAFLMVPIMLLILKIPTRMTIASSLAITFLSSIGSTAGKLATGQVLFLPALVVVIASLIASPLGAMTGRRANTKVLQVILSVLIFITAVKIWLDIL